MSNHSKAGTITTNTQTDVVTVGSGRVTFSATLNSGTGTMTWQFLGPDGIWTGILVNTTALAGTASHAYYHEFGGPVSVRGNATGGASPDWDWQIISAPPRIGS